MTTRHKWNRKAHPEDVEGLTQAVKTCDACGMSRTRDRTTKTLDVFRRKGTALWQGYRAGHIPDCVPVQEGS